MNTFSVQNLNFSYGREWIFHGTNFEAYKGRLTLILGKSGSGKTTFLDLLFGLLKPISGIILYNGELVQSADDMIGKVSYLISEPERYFFEPTVIAEVANTVRFSQKTDKEEAESRAREALRKVAVEEALFERDPFTLSKGEKRKVAIASVVAGGAETILMDEPLVGLDYFGVIAVVSTINELLLQGFTIVAVTHELDSFLHLTPDVYLVGNKELLKVDIEDLNKVKDVFQKSGVPLSERLKLFVLLADKGAKIDIHSGEVDFLNSIVEFYKSCT